MRTESLSAGGPVSQAAEKHLANPPSPITSFTWEGHLSYKAMTIINITSSDPIIIIANLEDIFCNGQLAAWFDVRHPLVNKADVARVGGWVWVHLRVTHCN